MSTDAQFCMECGLKIEPQMLAAIPEDVSCPRCKATLRCRTLGTTTLVECTQCAGLWLTPDHFERVCDNAEKEEAVRMFVEQHPGPKEVASSKVSYIPCIVCKDMMVRRNFGGVSGILIDLCGKHGIWLDHSELERVLEFVQKGGMHRARDLERRHQDSMRRQRAPILDASSFESTRGFGMDSEPNLMRDVFDLLGRTIGLWKS
jgi:Zn-finger nucleic acid-binding protein